MRWGLSRSPKWHKKGWRDSITGEMFININHSWSAIQVQREVGVKEVTRMSDLLRRLRDTIIVECGTLEDGMYLQIFFQRKALQDSDELAGSLFDGGETVYAKIFNAELREVRLGPDGGWFDAGAQLAPYGGGRTGDLWDFVNI